MAKYVIDKDSIITGTGRGVQYCVCIPDHKFARPLKDHDRKYIELHRAVYDLAHGGYTDPDKYDIHHKDGNPRNNNLSNLEKIEHGKHQEEHANKEKRWEKSKFWKKSPMTKPGKARKVAQDFLNRIISDQKQS
jgi:hypothetical protein